MSETTKGSVDEKEFQAWMAKNNLAPPNASTTEVPEYTGVPAEASEIDTNKADVGSAITNKIGTIASGLGGLYGIKKAYDVAQGYMNRPVAPAPAAQMAQQVGGQMAQQVGGQMAVNGGPAQPSAMTSTGRPLSVQTGGLGQGAAAVAEAAPVAEGAAGQGAFRTALNTAGRVGMNALNMAAPAAMLTAPAVMAGYEKAEIDKDPFNKKYENNPYAMSVRSEHAQKQITMGQAGQRNRRQSAYDAAERILSRGM